MELVILFKFATAELATAALQAWLVQNPTYVIKSTSLSIGIRKTGILVNYKTA
jgi:hypothetical protein